MPKAANSEDLLQANADLRLQNSNLLENLRVLQQEQESVLQKHQSMDARLFDYHSLLRAVRALHHCRGLAELFEILHAIVHDKLDCEESWSFLYDVESESFQLQQKGRCSESVAVDDEEAFSFQLEPGILWQLICLGEPFPVVNAAGELRFHSLFARKQLKQFDAAFWLPLVMENRPVGLLVLGPLRGEQKSFGESEVEFLRTVGEQASVAISSVLLYDTLQAEQEKLARTIRNVSVLYEISRAVSQIDNMKQLLLKILEEAIKRVGAQKGSIMLYDRDEDVLKLQVVRGIPDTFVEESINRGSIECKTFRPGEGIAGKVFETGKYHLSNNTKQDLNYKHYHASNINSILCLPLLIQDEVIGVLNITNKQTSSFVAEDIEILEAIANQAAMTIHKADLYQMAVTDELTGLYVRRYIRRRLEEENRRFRRYGNIFTIVLLDVDHFKQVNDSYGHEAGDHVLQEVARVMLEQTREIDVVARYGGEEFVVLMPQTNKEGAEVAVERLRKTLASTCMTYQEQTFRVTASFGICEASLEEESVADLFRNADIALYQAKHMGRNRAVAWEKDMELPTKPDSALSFEVK